jgi:predicted GNAT superfamily acetyltransferase
MPPEALPLPDGTPLALPLPDDIYVIRNADHVLSMAWRLWMREALLAAFAAGYQLTDCLRAEDGVWRYLLLR